MATKQSKEVKIQREVEKWLTSYDMEFVTQNESVNPEIDKALSKAPSKTGGEGANLVDVKNLPSCLTLMLLIGLVQISN